MATERRTSGLRKSSTLLTRLLPIRAEQLKSSCYSTIKAFRLGLVAEVNAPLRLNQEPITRGDRPGISCSTRYRRVDMLHWAVEQVRSDEHDGWGVVQAKAELS